MLTDVRRWRPGRIFTLLAYAGRHQWRIAPQLTNADRVNDDGILPFRVVVKAQFRQIDHNAFARGIRQQHLRRDRERGTGCRQVRIDA